MLLLNVCCAPCVLPLVDKSNPEQVLYFYNPNISPKDEYAKRFEAASIVAHEFGLKLIDGVYDHEEWLAYLSGNLPNELESYPENSPRCQACFEYRINNIAKYAKENGFDGFSTTLSVNRFKDTSYINSYSRQMADKYGIKYEEFKIDPQTAHQKGVELSKKLGLYRQRFCGCEFSQNRNTR
ncbi:MAG: epoxyqueuosine reductase QueH [Candidatus Margulisiibacteriota bacterium]